jgi:hypothetical protein
MLSSAQHHLLNISRDKVRDKAGEQPIVVTCILL